jgi:hypothetical protein
MTHTAHGRNSAPTVDAHPYDRARIRPIGVRPQRHVWALGGTTYRLESSLMRVRR